MKRTGLLLMGMVFLSLTEAYCQSESILVPQTGFLDAGNKIAIVRISADSFYIKDSGHKIVMRDKLLSPKVWPFSEENVSRIDLSSLTVPGVYQLELSGNTEVLPLTFEITADPYGDIANAAVKALYYNRCSYAILPEYGGKWARKAGHPDDKVYVHKSAVSEGRPEGFILSSKGGWYDAGDYNKYIVNSSISTYTLLLAYELFPNYWKTRCLNIPESNNSVSDLLDETLFNLRWMLTMQDKDGGVYHKLTTLQFEGFIMPEKANDKRYVIHKNTAASLDFAATMAHASVLLANFKKELPGLADSCKSAALKAWEWCKKNPGIIYNQPSDVSTGAYGDRNISDEWFWAATEMALLSQSELPDSLLGKLEFKTPAWGNVSTLGLISVLTAKEKVNTVYFEKCNKIFLSLVNDLVNKADQSAYPVSLDYFAWGSNSDIANQGMLKMVAWTITREDKFLNSAINDMNYLAGVNPTGFCFITGFGKKSPKNIHHRPSAADGIADPIPGFLAGGPNTVVMTDCPNAKRSKLPALSYVDEECSYSTNEIAINWNTPLAFLAGAVSSAGHKK